MGGMNCQNECMETQLVRMDRTGGQTGEEWWWWGDKREGGSLIAALRVSSTQRVSRSL